jgi:hypothetical protein
MRQALLVGLLASIGCNRTPPEAVVVGAEDLFAEYQKDSASADKKYRGALLRVTGRIRGWRSAPRPGSIHNNYIVDFEAGPDPDSGKRTLLVPVVAVVPPEKQPGSSLYRGNQSKKEWNLLDFDRGDIVTVVGRCRGREDDADHAGGFRVVLDDATVVAYTATLPRRPKVVIPVDGVELAPEKK